MKPIWLQILYGAVLLAGTFLSDLIAPHLVKVLPDDYRTDAIRTAAMITVYGGLLVCLWLARPVTRRYFDPCSRCLGQYSSIHQTRDSPISGEISIYGIFDIRHDALARAYYVEGTSFDLAKREPIGHWRSCVVHFDMENKVVAYIYSGQGADAREGGDDRESLGLCSLKFFDQDFEQGRGRFRDDTDDSVLMRTKFARLSKARLRQLTGKQISRAGTLDEQLRVLKSLQEEDARGTL